jgi:hypothetical protein
MRAKSALGGRNAVDVLMAGSADRSFDECRAAIARRAAILLGGTAAIALATGQPAHAISINDAVANSVGGAANYYDSTNQFPNVVSLFGADGSFCTGTLINSRTILTAAHCFYNPPTATVDPNKWVGGPTAGNPNLPIPRVSFTPIAGVNDPNMRSVTSIFVNRSYNQAQSTANDIAVITLANPVTAIKPATLMTAGTPIPTPGTTLVLAGYGNFGKGTNCCTDSDNKRRVATTEFGGYFADNAGTNQPFLYAQFRNPLSPNDPNTFNLIVPTSSLEGATASGDSGGPVFIQTANGLLQIGELRGDRLEVRKLAENFWQITAHFGFVQVPDLPAALRQAKASGCEIELRHAIFFNARDAVVAKRTHNLAARARLLLFAFMLRNAVRAVDLFRIPTDNFIEMGRLVEI